MVKSRNYFDIPNREEQNIRHFISLFKSKKKQVKVRPGAKTPDEVREIIKKIGKGKKVNIRRVDYDGTPEEHAVAVQIVDLRADYFTGNIINVERSIKQEMDKKLVYVKGGGGSIDFYYDDGDIMSIEEDIDETIIEQRNPEEILEILDALDLNESVLISYYDTGKGGVINGVGRLVDKNLEEKAFKLELTFVNDIELDKPKTVTLNLEKDAVLDLEVVL